MGDVAVTSTDGTMGNLAPYDNTALRNLEVRNLMPEISAGTLRGVNHACPEDSAGNLKGVGAQNEYHCGSEIGDGLYEYCKGAAGSADTDVQCAGVPAESVQCLDECGDWWYQCANGAAFVKPVPIGTKCKGAAFVVEAVCAASASTDAPSASSTPSSVSTVAPEATAAPTTAASSTAAPAPTECGSCSGCLASNGVCYPESKAFCDAYPQYTWCDAGDSSSTVAPSSESSTTPAPSTEAPTTAAPSTEAPSSASSTTPAPSTEAPTTAEPSTEAPTTAAPIAQCGLCNGGLANNGVCYAESQGFCDLYPQYTWCGARRLSGNLRR